MLRTNGRKAMSMIRGGKIVESRARVTLTGKKCAALNAHQNADRSVIAADSSPIRLSKIDDVPFEVDRWTQVLDELIAFHFERRSARKMLANHDHSPHAACFGKRVI